MGDSPQAQSELCQIWTVKLEGVGIRSSSNARPTTMGAGPRTGSGVTPRTAQSTVLGIDPTAVPRIDPGTDQFGIATGSQIDSRVAGRSALAGDVTVEVRGADERFLFGKYSFWIQVVVHLVTKRLTFIST